MRYHLVLVPGFGGFDALGKVQYYAGITTLFQDWSRRKPLVLHYFDNFPTAAVVTRAARLRGFLAKLIARGEICVGDQVTLAGHSTGALDIRQLVSDLHDPVNDPVHVDDGWPIPTGSILGCIKRIVFLSAPHWGTNIADWVKSHSTLRQAVVTQMQAAVAASQVFPADEVEQGIAGAAARLTGAEILRAVQDALTEANEHFGTPGPERTADAQEAASELALYLRHIGSDFSVIDDLASKVPTSGPASPAHFRGSLWKTEQARFRSFKVLSFATVGSRPFVFAEGKPAPVFDLANPWTWPEVEKDSAWSRGTDIAYRLTYRACAGGPFRRPHGVGKITRRLRGAPTHALELWDNDGIVNTLSMLWPRGENVLVAGDHLDIVGQYKLTAAADGAGRKYRTYDSLKSTPPFPETIFKSIWTEIFDFAAGVKAAKSRAAAAVA